MATTIRSTRGIRYATAARFEPPEVVPYSPGDELGVAGPMCPQVPGMLEQMLGVTSNQLSEDCLFLDVFAPDDAAGLPVLVWIHGGAFLNGGGSVPWYDGTRLAERGAVVVAINYRLGALGFLGGGNWGTLDQLCALEWVQQHIGLFGGDPGRVTIFGESAGGSSLVALMAAPASAGRVHGVWAMSPSINQLRTLEAASCWEAEFLEAAGVGSVDEARSLPLDAVLAAQTAVTSKPNVNYDMFSPAAGGTGLPADLLGAAAANPVPFCVGTNRDENLLFLAFDPTYSSATVDQWHQHTERQFGDRAPVARTAYESARPGSTPLQLIAAAQTDHAFRRPAQRLREARDEHGHSTWMYWFTWASPAFGGVLGSAHALDIPFAFDNLHAPGAAMLLGDDTNGQALATRFADEIVAFARSAGASWPAFDRSARPTLRLDVETELVHDPEPTLRALHA
ncbi:MAG: carboxylesterase/lipase family protein [Ilumatobacteraceae bacterium]